MLFLVFLVFLVVLAFAEARCKLPLDVPPTNYEILNCGSVANGCELRCAEGYAFTVDPREYWSGNATDASVFCGNAGLTTEKLVPYCAPACTLPPLQVLGPLSATLDFSMCNTSAGLLPEAKCLVGCSQQGFTMRFPPFRSSSVLLCPSPGGVFELRSDLPVCEWGCTLPANTSSFDVEGCNTTTHTLSERACALACSVGFDPDWTPGFETVMKATCPGPGQEFMLPPPCRLAAPTMEVGCSEMKWRRRLPALGEIVQTDDISFIDVSVDGRFFLTAGEQSGVLRIYELAGVGERFASPHRQLIAFPHGINPNAAAKSVQIGIRAAAFTHDSLMVLSAGADGVVRMWSLQNFSIVPVANFTHETGNSRLYTYLDSLVVSPNGKWAFSCSWTSRFVQQWDLIAQVDDPLASLEHAKCQTLAVSPDSSKLYTGGSHTGEIRVWDLLSSSGRYPTPVGMIGYGQQVSSSTVSANGNTIVHGARGFVATWPARRYAQQPSWIYKVSNVAPTSVVKVSADQSWIVSLSGFKVYLANLVLQQDESGSLLMSASASSLTLSPDSAWFATAYKNVVTFHEFGSRSVRPVFSFDHGSYVNNVAAVSNGIMSVDQTKGALVWDAFVSSAVPKESYVSGSNAPSTALTPNGRFVFIGGHTVRMISRETGAIVADLKHPGAGGLTVSLDGTLLVASTYFVKPLVLRVWNIRRSPPELLGTFDHGEKMFVPAITPDNSMVISGSADDLNGHGFSVKIWDLRTRSSHPILTIPATSEVRIISVSPDGAYFFVGSNDIMMYSLRNLSANPVASFQHSGGSATSLQVSHDGSWLVSSSTGAKLWNLRSRAQHAEAVWEEQIPNLLHTLTVDGASLVLSSRGVIKQFPLFPSHVYMGELLRSALCSNRVECRFGIARLGSLSNMVASLPEWLSYVPLKEINLVATRLVKLPPTPGETVLVANLSGVQLQDSRVPMGWVTDPFILDLRLVKDVRIGALSAEKKRSALDCAWDFDERGKGTCVRRNDEAAQVIIGKRICRESLVALRSGLVGSKLPRLTTINVDIEPFSFWLCDCLPGSFGNGSTCESCPVDQYCASTPSIFPRSCPPGSTTNGATGANNSMQCHCNAMRYPVSTVLDDVLCDRCPPGTFSNVGDSQCIPCPPGTYASSTGCAPCGFGFFAPAKSSHCFECPSGTVSAAGGSTCVGCPAGTYASRGMCIDCSAGYYSVANSSGCVECPPGTLSDVGSGSCRECRAGTFARQGVCMNCPLGRYSQARSSKCLECPSGSVTTAGSSACEKCHAGSVASNGQCVNCSAGFQSVEGSAVCTECPSGTVSKWAGALCSPCKSTDVLGLSFPSQPSVERSSCQVDLAYVWRVVLGLLSMTFLGRVCAPLFCIPLAIKDISMDNGQVILTTANPHGLSAIVPVVPVVFRGTSVPWLDTTDGNFLHVNRVSLDQLKIMDSSKCALNIDTQSSLGTVRFVSPLQRPQSLFVLPFALSLLQIPLFVWILGSSIAVSVCFVDVSGEGSLLMAPGIIGVGVFLSFVSVVLVARREILARSRTPLAHARRRFKKKLLAHNRTPSACVRGSARGVTAGQLANVFDFFTPWLHQKRTMRFLVPAIINPLTEKEKLSYSEVAGPSEATWFVSHYWGTPFVEFVNSIRHHAIAYAADKTEACALTVCEESVDDEVVSFQADGTQTQSVITESNMRTEQSAAWRAMAYWVCSFSNNQWKLAEEIPPNAWNESSFFKTLKSSHLRGTVMIIDSGASPLSRSWCLFEVLQTFCLESRKPDFLGLLLCTEAGVLNLGRASMDLAMQVGRTVKDLRLEDATASLLSDKEMIDNLIVEMGGFSAINGFVKGKFRDALLTMQNHHQREMSTLVASIGAIPDNPTAQSTSPQDMSALMACIDAIPDEPMDYTSTSQAMAASDASIRSISPQVLTLI